MKVIIIFFNFSFILLHPIVFNSYEKKTSDTRVCTKIEFHEFRCNKSYGKVSSFFLYKGFHFFQMIVLTKRIEMEKHYQRNSGGINYYNHIKFSHGYKVKRKTVRSYILIYGFNKQILIKYERN